MSSSLFKSLIICLFACIGCVCHAEESLDFIAEHILEVPMDFRYFALPETPVDRTKSEWRLQGGVGFESGGLIDADIPMLAAQYYRPFDNAHGFTFSAFYDQYRISGGRGSALVEPSFAALSNPLSRFTANVTNISGKGFHSGLSASYVFYRNNGANLQIGAVLETIRIRDFTIRFDSLGLTPNFSGELNYAATYNALTPYASYEFAPNNFTSGFSGRLKILFAWPLPRVGFKGSISGPGFEFTSDTDKVGKGRHIPDIFFGVGYSLEQHSGWRFELGGLAYIYLVEPKVHEQIDSPIFISVSKRF